MIYLIKGVIIFNYFYTLNNNDPQYYFTDIISN